MWQSGGVLFLALEVSQNPVEGLPRFIGYDALILNTSDDSNRASTASTDLDVDIEDALESLGPGQLAPPLILARIEACPIAVFQLPTVS